MMGKRRLGSVFGGMWLTLGVGACVGQAPVVGANTQELGDPGGAPAHEPQVPGVQGTLVDQSISYIVTQVRPPDPGVDPTSFCMPRPLPVESSGLASCHVLRIPLDESGVVVPASACNCEGADHLPPDPALRETAFVYLHTMGYCDVGAERCADMCLCELVQTSDARRRACLADEPLEGDGNGWCYVSPDEGLGLPETVAGCADSERRRVRFFGDETGNSFNILMCGAVTAETHASGVEGAPVGSPCLPLQEIRSNFADFHVTDVTLDLGTPACDSGICLVNHFEGRVSCPYGQLADDVDAGNAGCFVPGADVSVTTPVEAQLVSRRPEDTVTCSCQCKGPGPGPYCDCPSGTVCAPLVDSVGVAAADAHVGSYCIARGTEYEPSGPISFVRCGEAGAESCGEPRPY
jgi:hypothetical protein